MIPVRLVPMLHAESSVFYSLFRFTDLYQIVKDSVIRQEVEPTPFTILQAEITDRTINIDFLVSTRISKPGYYQISLPMFGFWTGVLAIY